MKKVHSENEKNLELAPGDRYVRIAIVEATREIDGAINKTIADLFTSRNSASDAKTNAKNHGDLFRIVRFPSGPARELARASEVYERALVNIRKHVDEGKVLATNTTEFNYKDLLSEEYLDLLAQLSGCAAHRVTPNCTDMCYHKKYRSIDGTCNNMKNPLWGSSLTGFRRLLPPQYENDLSTPIGWTKGKLYNGFEKPSARLISSSVISTDKITPDERITHMVMQWGQFLDHDLDHALPPVISETWDGVDCKKTCDFAAPCYPIMVPPNDTRVTNRRCIDFVRSSAVCGSGMTSIFFGTVEPREQINQLTAWIDGSQVYGYSEAFAHELRNLSGEVGTLREGVHFPGQKSLLPFAAPQDGIDCRRDAQESEVNCFTAGDIRVNEQTGLLAMHTIWLREHNRIATELKEHNPHWDGDTLYQEARKIVGAMMQHVTYKEWLPLIIGDEGIKMLGDYKSYDPELNPSISNEFATAALRFGHSLINPILHRLDSEFNPIPQGHLPLHKAFFAPWRLVYEGGVDPLMRGLFTVPAKLKKPDQNLNSDLTEKLFETAHAVALDLAAINIQRGRDHAIPSYNEYRKLCNMTEAKTFDDLKEISSDAVRSKLKELYGHPSNIDIWVGGILEDQLPGAKVGPLFRCIMVDQFRRLRDGDRLWYENEKTFNEEQRVQLEKTSLARVLCDNGDNITKVTENVFLLPKLQGGYVTCDKIPSMDLRYWQDCEKCTKGKSDALRRQRREERQRLRRDTKSASKGNETIGKNAHLDNEGDYVNEDMNEERIEGLEQLIENFQKSLRQMRKKLKKLERQCLNFTGKDSLKELSSDSPKDSQNAQNTSPKDKSEDKKTRKERKQERKEKRQHCVDQKGIRRVNKEVWYRDDCTKCECQRKQINCTIEKCLPDLKCDKGQVTYKKQGECCSQCIPEGQVPSNSTQLSSSTTQITPVSTVKAA
uniref:CSON013346 protein n=1 Tax=Culicoides sonorensis TaxID=179676 RepID=A0A336M809_CULSO